MKPAWRLWLVPGLVAVTLMTIAALIMTGRDVETDLGSRVAAQLANDGQPWASPDVSGRTVTIMGTAPTLIAQRLAVESAQRVWGVGLVIDGSGIIPLQSTYRWSATRAANGVTISGFAPSDEVKQAIEALAKRALSPLPIQDRSELARGQPVGFLVMTDFALRRLAELSEGTVTLTGPALTIEGISADEPSFASTAKAIAQELPGGVEVRAVRVLPPRVEHFTWTASYEDGTLAIEGYVPSDASRRDIDAAIAAVVPGAKIDDRTRLASGAPDGFVSAVAFAAAQLNHLESGRISLSDGVLSIEGKAKSVADYEATVAEIGFRQDKREGGVRIGTADIVPAHVDPYVWRADRNGRTVVLTGYVPTDKAHADILAAAQKVLSGTEITDRLRVADGDPKMDWIGALKFSLDQLALLGKGSISLTGRKYDIQGEAASAAAYGALLETLKKNLPASMELRQATISPAAVSPFVFAVVRVPDGVNISGYVPTDDIANRIAAVARPKFGDDRLEMRVLLAGGAPDGFADAVIASLQAVSRLDGGRMDLVDQRMTLAGIAVSEEARRQIEADLRAKLPPAFELQSSMMVAVGGDPLTGPDCETALRAETEHDKVQFEGSTAEIAEDSAGLLDRIAGIVQRCPAATIEIAGHTDSAGGPKRNQVLSEQRANAVADRLAADGVRRERLSPVGYGGTRPIASNSTAAGREQNRRIEFGVVGQ